MSSSPRVTIGRVIERVIISGYRCFQRLDFAPNPATNLLVGANEAGKSTVLEAIALALTGRINGRWAGERATSAGPSRRVARKEASGPTGRCSPPRVRAAVPIPEHEQATPTAADDLLAQSPGGSRSIETGDTGLRWAAASTVAEPPALSSEAGGWLHAVANTAAGSCNKRRRNSTRVVSKPHIGA